ncbi:MAG: hypothetical protein DRR16_10910 [Candidatus Parabeggiatoa sp. nov. 3]|nr:MAG: hypothetical protein DRR16_10910 [Gammaproteobacteria bacterium]
MIIPLYLLLFFVLFHSANAIAQPCWADLKASSAPRTFILAMGANTGHLKKANDDAQSFADAIQKRFQVPSSQKCVLTDITFSDFRWNLKKLLPLVRVQDTVFIYFSGHGTTG